MENSADASDVDSVDEFPTTAPRTRESYALTAKPEEAFSEPATADFVEEVPLFVHKLKPRQRQVCLLYASGKTLTEVAKQTGYTIDWLSKMMKHPTMQSAVDRIRNLVFEEDAVARMKQMNRQALDTVDEVFELGSLKERKELAMWTLEKTTGKARQEVQHESGTILAFMERLDRLAAAPQRQLGYDTRDVIDVTPGRAEGEPTAPPEAEKGSDSPRPRDWIRRELPQP